MQTNTRRYLAIAGVTLSVYAGLKYILPVMLPFFIGWLLAVWLHPLLYRLEKKLHVKRSLLAAIFMGSLVFLLGFLFWKGGQVFLTQCKEWIQHLPLWKRKLCDIMENCCANVEHMTGIRAEATKSFLIKNAEQIQNNFMESLGPDTLLQATTYMKSLVFLITTVIVTVISGILFVKDLTDIRKTLRGFRFYPKWRRVLKRLKNIGAAYFKAQLIIMVVIALICTAGMWFLKSPYYLLFGIGLGILDALPLIGTGLILYPAILIALLKGEYFLALGCLGIELTTSIVRELMEPRLIGNKLGIYPILIMLSIYTGLFIYGIAGFILGPATLLLVYSIGLEWDLWG